MSDLYEIRAKYSKSTITIYQAYASNIAAPALERQEFVKPFSFHRMTWIKPSFLWLMYRSIWGQKKSQENILAVQIERTGWDHALSLGVLTHPEPSVYGNPDEWKSQFDNASVHIQWDTERNIRGSAMNRFSIQVGISRHLIREYVEDWIVKIDDLTPTVTKIRNLIRSGKMTEAKRLLPPEKPYPVEPKTARRIMMNDKQS